MREHRSLTSLPSPFVSRYVHGIKSGGRVLDVACGSGRHIAHCRTIGLQVTGVDRNIAEPAIRFATDPAVTLIEADLETDAPPPFVGARFDGVIVTNYLWRPRLAAIVDAVATDGLLIYETFALGNERFGKPANPDFLLRPGELLEATRAQLVPICYEHSRLTAPDRIVQRLCAVGPAHRWANEGASPV